MNVASGHAVHLLDSVGDRQHVVGERPLEASLLVLRRAEVDYPGIDPVLAQDRGRARCRGNVVDVSREHHGRHQEQRRPLALVRVVPPQSVDALLRDDLVRRGFVLGG